MPVAYPKFVQTERSAKRYLTECGAIFNKHKTMVLLPNSFGKKARHGVWPYHVLEFLQVHHGYPISHELTEYNRVKKSVKTWQNAVRLLKKSGVTLVSFVNEFGQRVRLYSIYNKRGQYVLQHNNRQVNDALYFVKMHLGYRQFTELPKFMSKLKNAPKYEQLRRELFKSRVLVRRDQHTGDVTYSYPSDVNWTRKVQHNVSLLVALFRATIRHPRSRIEFDQEMEQIRAQIT